MLWEVMRYVYCRFYYSQSKLLYFFFAVVFRFAINKPSDRRTAYFIYITINGTRKTMKFYLLQVFTLFR